MSFDKKNLELLKTLGRTLPQKIPQESINTEIQEDNKNKKNKSIKKDKDLETFFRELIEKSPDGNIPKHLLSDLKEMEKEKEEIIKSEIETSNKSNESKSYAINKNFQQRSYNNRTKKKPEEQNLYSSFERLLLEEEDP